MELVIIFSTIIAFFAHYTIEKGSVANVVGAITATLVTWLLVSYQAGSFAHVSLIDIRVTLVIAFVVSMLVGLVFVAHKRCSKQFTYHS